ncbi:MAG: TolC family protein [Bacteroidia bacterium]
MKQIIFSVFFLISGVSHWAVAQSQRLSLASLEQVSTLVLQQNPDGKIYLAKQQKSKQELHNQYGAFAPTITGNFNGQYNIDRQTTALPGIIFNKPNEMINVQMGTDYIYNTGLSASVDILNFQTIFQVKTAKLNTELQTAQSEAFHQLLREQTALYYFGVLIGKKNLEIQQLNLLSADSTLALSKQKYAQGIIDLASLNQAQIALNQVKIASINSEKTVHFYTTQLKNLLGLTPKDELVFGDSVGLQTKAFPNFNSVSPDKNLALYRLQYQVAKSDLLVKKAAFLPRLSVNGYWGFQQLSNEFWANDWSKYNYVGLNLSLPIMNGYRNIGNAKLANWNAKIQAQIQENEELKAQNKEAQLLDDYQNALQQLVLAKENYQLYQENKELTFQKYSQEIIGLDAYLKSYDDYLKAENQYLSALSLTYGYYATLFARK